MERRFLGEAGEQGWGAAVQKRSDSRKATTSGTSVFKGRSGRLQPLPAARILKEVEADLLG